MKANISRIYCISQDGVYRGLTLVMNEMCLWGVLQAIKGLILMKIGTMF